MKEVRSEFIEEVVAFFNQGALLKSQRIEKGQSNISYYVSTTTGTFALRFFTQFNALRFNNEITIQESLDGSKVPHSSLLRSLEGKSLFNQGGFYATLSPWIDGHHLSRPLLPITVERIGAIMAQFHVTLDPETKIHDQYLFMGSRRREDRLTRIPDGLIKSKIQSMLQEAEDEIQETPSGILHGDVHLDNILANKNGTLTLLDFQSSGKGKYVYDLGRSIADICNNHGVLDTVLVGAYVKGYSRVRNLERLEIQSLPAATSIGACSIALWAFEKKKLAMRDEYLSIARDAKLLSAETLFIN